MNRGWIVAVAVALNIGFSTSVLGVTESIEGIFNASEGGNPTFNEIERIVINDYLAQPNDGEMGGAEKLTNPIPSLGSKKTAFLSSSVDSTHEKIALLEPGQILPVGVLKRPLPREIEARLPLRFHITTNGSWSPVKHYSLKKTPALLQTCLTEVDSKLALHARF